MNTKGNHKVVFGQVQTHPTIKELVRKEIRDAIITGKFRGGEVISQVELARELGVSRGPVREALMELERDGLVSNHPYQKTIAVDLGLVDRSD